MKKVINFIEKYIRENIAQSNTLAHHLGARDFLLELDPNASVEAQIAALTHDIERQFRERIKDPKIFSDKEYLLQHGKASADIVYDLLKDKDFDLDLGRVSWLIANHELGGDHEADLLRDADSLSFLKNTVKGFAEKFGKKECRQKFDYMLDRIQDKRAKEIAKQYYNEALRLLEE